MRITIGHLLIMFLLGGGAALGALRASAAGGIGKVIEGVSARISTLKGMFSAGRVEDDIPAKALPADSPLISTVTEAPAAPAPANEKPAIPEGALTVDETIPDPEPAPAKVEDVKPAAAPAPVKRTRRRRTAAKPAAKAAAAAPAAKPRRRRAAKPAVDALVGTYVTLTLRSGREVKGVLESKTSTSYMIQLPGMGPFEYAASDVTAIKAVE